MLAAIHEVYMYCQDRYQYKDTRVHRNQPSGAGGGGRKMGKARVRHCDILALPLTGGITLKTVLPSEAMRPAVPQYLGHICMYLSWKAKSASHI